MNTPLLAFTVLVCNLGLALGGADRLSLSRPTARAADEPPHVIARAMTWATEIALPTLVPGFGRGILSHYASAPAKSASSGELQ